jgi:hypothetical protein
MKAILGIALFAAVVAAAVWERNSIGKLRAENEALRVERLEADQLANENRELPGLRAAAGAIVAGENASSSTELLRLRGEVNRLRAQTQDPAKLRAENERIAAEIASGKFAPKRLADMEGFVPREQWTSAGLATPEAAVQSYFGAIVAADVDLMLRCLTLENAEPMRRQFEQDPVRFRNEFQKEVAQLFGKATGMRIAGKRQLSEDSVSLHVQFAAEGTAMPMTLRRVANEWKVDKLE